MPEATDGCGSTTISIDYAPYTAATLAGYGWDFVVADVVGFEPAIFNTPDGKRPPGFGTNPSGPPDAGAETRLYTPVNVEIDRAISGSSKIGPNQVLVEGGTAGCYTVWVDVAPRLELGSRYVLILAKAMDAAGQNPLPLQEAKIAWLVDGEGMVATVDLRMSIDQLTRIVRQATPSTDP
jgi:hypothetical protein